MAALSMLTQSRKLHEGTPRVGEDTFASLIFATQDRAMVCHLGEPEITDFDLLQGKHAFLLGLEKLDLTSTTSLPDLPSMIEHVRGLDVVMDDLSTGAIQVP